MIDIIIQFVPFSILLSLLIYNIKRLGRIIAMSNFIIGIYTFSLFSYGVCSVIKPTYYYNMAALLAVFFSILFLTNPLSSFERRFKSPVQLIHISYVKYRYLSFLIIILGFYSLSFFLKNLPQVFASDISTLRYRINSGNGFYESSIFSKLAILGAFLSPVAHFLYFYSTFLLKREAKIISRFLLISSTSFIFYTLNVAGRDGFILWSFSFISLFCLFYPVLPKERIRKTVKSLLLVFVFSAPVFLFITVQRFGVNEHYEDGVIFSLFDYQGQQLFELSDRIDKLKTIEFQGNMEALFPILSMSGFGADKPNRFELREGSLAVGLRTYRFAFYLGAFYIHFRWIGVLVFSILMYVVFAFSFKIEHFRISIPRLLIGFSWYMILITGVFYFYYATLMGNVFLLIPFLIYFFLIFKK